MGYKHKSKVHETLLLFKGGLMTYSEVERKRAELLVMYVQMLQKIVARLPEAAVDKALASSNHEFFLNEAARQISELPRSSPKSLRHGV